MANQGEIECLKIAAVFYRSPPPCIVDENFFRHLFLVPAGIILTVLAFLRRRRSFKKDICGGRPGLVIPVDFLGFDHDRLAIMFVFGATAGTILDLLLHLNINTAVSNSWTTAFLTIGLALEPAFLYYPYFACLASYHRIIGAMMGFPYAVIL
ncbi:stimulated by retinoic acid gene 6 protein-like [Dendronephthya gigantea]|uniref:stimulated by retinoic acid gene 6 protein-like n=1 Tax=Dendronephthya gigantea TaxID=151771 RepID=UPI00106D2AAE|nr:stimulated by retinoic acid gene 6 protein-like [Dendronephthya gigantea]